MIRSIKPTDYTRLTEIWESAVRATHEFLKEEDFIYYKEHLPTYFQFVKLFGYELNGVLVGFVGVADHNIEMLFIDNNCRGNGIGRELVSFVINDCEATTVDVNEQNDQAVGFYKHMGFEVSDRSELDGDGKAYPILHMRLGKPFMK